MTSSLFSWQRAVLASQLPAALRLTAVRIALDSHQSTGRSVVINAAAVAEDLDCSERTVWRQVRALVAGGWMVQTEKPTYQGSESGGRRARYMLTEPGEAVESSATVTCGKSDDTTDSPDTPSVPVSHDTPSRLTNRPESSATTTPTGGTLSASNGSSSSSCSDVPIDILASKLRRYTVLASLRVDKLKPAQANEIRDLIEIHGDQRLVDNAMRTVRRDDPPQTIQAFLPGWRVMPRPGDRALAVVPDPPCPIPGHSGTTKHCTQCAAEQLEAKGLSR